MKNIKIIHRNIIKYKIVKELMMYSHANGSQMEIISLEDSSML